MRDRSRIVHTASPFRWKGVAPRRYKADGTHFRGIERYTLLGHESEDAGLRSVLRYFEIEAGGYSSLERHEHAHMVVVLRGRGHVILGDSAQPISLHDCVYVAPGTIHQFHATEEEPLGFLCVVDRVRDRPVLASPAEKENLSRDPCIARLLKR